MNISDLYKIDALAYNSQIGHITNLSTTLYEIQSQYPVGSKEYNEINNRLKLCCSLQSSEIDSAKGIEKKPVPKHWTKYNYDGKKDGLNISQDEIDFNNKILIEDRPYFMRYLYSDYNTEYKNKLSEFDRYCMTVWGYSFDDVPAEIRGTKAFEEVAKYRDKKLGLLTTNGPMNRLCRHMEESLAMVRQSNKDCDCDKLFDLLYNSDIPINNDLLEQMVQLKNQYVEFKKSKSIKASMYATYEQFYRVIRNEALANISNNIQELANLALYVCYKMNPKKPKDFVWDCFGRGICENLMQKRRVATIPTVNAGGDKRYLGKNYAVREIVIGNSNDYWESIEDFSKCDDMFADGTDNIFDSGVSDDNT